MLRSRFTNKVMKECKIAPIMKKLCLAMILIVIFTVLMSCSVKRAPTPTPEVEELSAKEWYNKGFALLELERYEEAIECYDKALEINTDSPAFNSKIAAKGKLLGEAEPTSISTQAIQTEEIYGLLWSLDMGHNAEYVSVSYDGSYIVALFNGETLCFLNKGGKLLWKYETVGKLLSVSISSNGSYVVVGTQEGKIYFFVKISSFTNKERWIGTGDVFIYDYGTANDFDLYPLNLTNNFTTSDSTIHFWTYLSVSGSEDELTWKIYSPDGIRYYSSSTPLGQYYTPPEPGTANIQNIHILHYAVPVAEIADKPGEWRAELYVNDTKAATLAFRIPGNISASMYPIIGTSLAVFPLVGAIFGVIRVRRKRRKPKVAVIENWKADGLIIGHFIAIIWSLMLCVFLYLSRYLEEEMNVFLGYGVFLTSVLFCFLGITIIHNFLTYRRLSRNNLYFSAALAISCALFLLFSGAFVPASIIEAASLSSVIVLIPLFTPNLVSMSVVRRYGDLLLPHEAKILTVPTFPVELERFYSDAEYIGGGGFAWVFSAARKDGTKIAVKIPTIKDEKTGMFFLSEVANWSALDHKNIVKFYNANVFPIPYLEMELCDRSLEFEQRSVGEAVSITYEIAQGLSYAHAQKVVHADIKHSNILIKDGKIKISDWGLSKVKRGKSLSVAGLTPEYAAPEQVLGKIDERTDIWQLGVVFYELVTGKLPFEGEYAEVINHVINDEPIHPSEINPDSKYVEHIILKCLRKEKEGRYQSVEELLRELEEYKPGSRTAYAIEEKGNAETLQLR